MKTWFPRLIMTAFAAMLALAIYGGYRKIHTEESRPAAAAALLQETDRRMIKGFNEFGKAFYLEASKEKGASGNVFLSPYSAASALSMVYNGASGEAAEELVRILRYPSSHKEEVSRSGKAVMDASVRTMKQAEFRIGNSIWLRKGWAFSPDYLALNQRFYQAEAQSLDFNSPSAPDRINEWAKKQSRGKIDRIVEQIDKDVISILLNAVTFKGEWAKPFDPSRTDVKAFTLDNGTEKPVLMMETDGTYNYFESEEAQAVRLPYGDGRLGMTLYVPGNKTGKVDPLVQWLLAEGGLKKINGALKEKYGKVDLPRFQLEFRLELREPLKRMGIQKAFDQASDGLNGMLAQPANDVPLIGNVFLSSVLQKSYVEVNEEGTKAAAVTKVEGKASSAGPAPGPFRFAANRPFFFTIEDEDTGLILFMGTVKEP